MGQVPTACLLPSFANERILVDVAGCLTLKFGTTRRPTYCNIYVVILCMPSCQIDYHEFVSNLTAEAFLAALRHAISSKGKQVQILSGILRPLYKQRFKRII